MSNAGVIRLASKKIFISDALANGDIALEQIEDGLWNLVFYKTSLGRYDEREGLITGTDFRNLKNYSSQKCVSAARTPVLSS